MSHRTARFLMLWVFVALQTMTPFIHAHAGAVQLNHGGLLHLHQGVHGDASYHVIAAHEHGSEVAVARGLPQRTEAQCLTPDALYVSSPVFRQADILQPGAGLPAPPQLDLARPDHTLPHALAPPIV